MRPPGDISKALFGAAEALTSVDDGGQRRGATLREMAQKACVGIQAARYTVQDLCRAGKLEPVGERRVEYRNRPVVEYAPAHREKRIAEEEGFFDVASVFATWAQG